MKLFSKLLPILALALFVAAPGFAQTGNLTGKVVDTDGKPLVGAVMSLERQGTNQKFETKTDKNGQYIHAGLPTGAYRVTVMKDGKPAMALDTRVNFGGDAKLDFDLKNAAAAPANNASREEAAKKIAEEKAKNEATRNAFDKARAALAAADATTNRDEKKKNFEDAINLFGEAAKSDATQHVIFANLGDAQSRYAGVVTDASARAKAYDDAAASYNKAIELKPDEAAYYNNLGIVLANANKIDEATQKLQKAAELNPAAAGQSYYNLGAVLTNKGKTKEASDAFKKAIELKPDMAPAYYQLGISYFGSPDTIPQAIPALQKFLELQPTGQDAEAAKQLLDAAKAAAPTGYKSDKAIAEEKAAEEAKAKAAAAKAKKKN